MPSGTRAAAGVAEGVGSGHAPTVHTGTPLAPRLLDISRDAAARASAAAPGSKEELEACLVAILCAHAAIEASLNEAIEYAEYASPSSGLQQWWEDREALRTEVKWADLIEHRTGTRPAPGSRERNGIVQLSGDRNLIAHGRGVKQAGGRKGVSGPPVTRRGGITKVQAHFDAMRAAERVRDAEAAISLIPTAPL